MAAQPVPVPIMPSTTNITLVGDVCIDHNVVNGRRYVSWGSSLMYMGRYLTSHSKANVAIIAAHGKDFEQYIDGVKIVNSSVLNNSLIYENIVQGEGRIQYCHNLSSSKPVDINSAVRKILENTDIFIFAPLTPNYSPEYIKSLLNHVPTGSLKLLTPQGFMRNIDDRGLVSKTNFSTAKDIVPLFDVVVASDEDCDQALEAAQQWVSFNKDLEVIITQNKNGATLVNKNGLRHVSTAPVAADDIVDLVGSGDVFSAQMILDYYEGKDILQAIADGNAAARKKLLTPIR